MKREFYKRLYFFELKTRRALDVFQLSLSRVKSYGLFDAVVRCLAPEDLGKFFELAEGTTYDLSRTGIVDLLYRVPFTKQAYTAFRRLHIGPLRRQQPPLLGVYNYCYYKEKTGDYSVDIALGGDDEIPIDSRSKDERGDVGCRSASGEDGPAKRLCTEMGEASTPERPEAACGSVNEGTVIHLQDTRDQKMASSALESLQCKIQPGQARQKSCRFIFTSFTPDELEEIRRVLKEMCIRNRGDELLKEYVRLHIKDELLQAILDENGRVNGALHPVNDLLLVKGNQIYGLPEAKLVESSLCRAWCCGGECIRCHNRVFGELMAPCGASPGSDRMDTSAQGTNGEDTRARPPINCTLSQETIHRTMSRLDTALLEDDLDAACNILLHCRELGNARILRIVLRLYASRRGRAVLERHGYNSIPVHFGRTLEEKVCSAIDSFDITTEVERTVISFLKSRTCPFGRVLSLIPSLLKTKCLNFACFAVMADEVLGKTNPYQMMRIRTLMHKHEGQFREVIDMIIAYYYEKWSNGAGDALSEKMRMGGASLCISGKKRPNTSEMPPSLDVVDNPGGAAEAAIDANCAVHRDSPPRRSLFCLEDDDASSKDFDPSSRGLSSTTRGQRVLSQGLADSSMDGQAGNQPSHDEGQRASRNGELKNETLFLSEAENRAPSTPSPSEELLDYKYLHTAFAGLAGMYSMSASGFVRRYFFSIFITVHRNRRYFTEDFLRRNAHYILIKKIMDGAPPFECNNVDVMVGLMFSGNFNHSSYFKPSPRDFMRRNLSQLLFKIKRAYRGGDYDHAVGEASVRCCAVTGRSHVIYKILRHILTSVQIPLYFNYIWPTIEYFLNREECECGLDFTDWLRCEHYSPLMVPYMRVPFAEIGDLPIIPGIEGKLYHVLLRFFSFQNADSADMMLRGDPALGPSSLPQSRLPEEYFVENFLCYYCSSPAFKNKILDVFPGCPPRVKALFGSLGREHRRAILMKAPENIPRFILEHFLLRIDYNHQELYSFVIQEFLKNIDVPLDPEVENMVGQFRHTRYELQDARELLGGGRGAEGVRVDGSYADFLRSLLRSLCGRLDSHGYLGYLVLFGADILEYSCLCLIKICHGEVPGFALDWLAQAVNEYYRDFSSADYEEMLRFMLKINMFVGGQLCSKRDCLNYYLVLKDYYGVIQLLDGAVESESERGLLQLAYFRIGDIVRVKALNKQELIYTAVTLFSEFAAEWNFKAAWQCYNGFLKQSGGGAVGRALGSDPGNAAIACIMKEILDMNYSEEGTIDYNNAEYGRALLESCVYGGWDLSIAKDCSLVGRATVMGCASPGVTGGHLNITPAVGGEEFVQPEDGGHDDVCGQDTIRSARTGDGRLYSDRISRRHGGFSWCPKDRNCMLHISMDCHLIKHSKDLDKTLDIITRRREIAENKESIMKMHMAIGSYLGVPRFLKTVELEFIRSLRLKRDYANCMSCLAKLLIRHEWDALYECALLKLDKKEFSDARELLGRVTMLCSPGSDVYCKAVVRLCELNKNAEMYARHIKTMEDNLLEAGGASCLVQKTDSTAQSGRIIIDLNRCSSGAWTGTVPSQAQFDAMKSHKNYEYLQRLYFAAAQLLEKSDLLLALSYYQRSFNSNYGAVPRFFHLIAKLPHSYLPHVERIVSDIVRNNLSGIIPYYTQISNRLSITTDSFRFYNTATRAMLEAAPHETFWDTLILINSRREDLRTRMQALIDGLSLDNRVLFRNTQRIAEQFTKISRSKSKTISIDDFELKSLLPSNVSVPGRRARIHGIRDDVLVFVSLQHPKRIVLVGDDGVEYPMIVKYKDDLRKDSRMMEMGMLLNKLFEDGYYIRTYRVIPFSHDAGIIEYVPGLISLKGICVEFYTHINEVAASFAKHRRIGGNNMERILKLFPPVFHGWLKKQHPDPYTFYARRENYVRTYAIMCIVGWFTGLGDRHAENTHFDLSSGDVVHVDLNCIFDKGTTFEIPERVPFRLTHNIVDGFGCLKLEGPFRRTMHYTLRVLKANKDVILSNMLSFLFDPLFEWARKKNEPERILDALGERLDFDNEEEMANQMIQEATSLNNLGSMYIGWMPFL